MNDTQHDLRGLQLAERYQIDDMVAQGGLCTVYRGQDTILRRPIAIKAIKPDLVDTYRIALQSTSALSHPAIVETYDAVEYDGNLFLMQEYLQARPLTGYLRAGVPSERAVDLGGQIARVLAYAHAHDVTHGDLTPSAILIDRRAIVRINNFGLPADEVYFATLDNTLVEPDTERAIHHTTPHDTTPDDDVRALGLLLWQLLRDHGDETQSTFRDDVHADLRDLVRRCVVRSHPQRLTEAEALVLELEVLARTLAAARPTISEDTPAALRAAREVVEREAAWSSQDTQGASRRWSVPSAGVGVTAHTADNMPTNPASYEPATHRPYNVGRPLITGAPRLTLPSRPIGDGEARRVVRTDPMPWPSSLPPKLDDAPTLPSVRNRMSFGLILALCLILFALFFIFGYLAPPLLGQP